MVKKNLLMPFLTLLTAIGLSGCEPIINTMAFHPDSKNVIPANQLPQGVKELFIETKDNVDIQIYFIAAKQSEPG